MIAKFVLIVWIGLGQSQSITVATFETESECKAVAAVMRDIGADYGGQYPVCVEYTFEGNKP
jgi:hypothetical protein